MTTFDRRQFVAIASAMGAVLAWPVGAARASARHWSERRDLYPEGVASGDPAPDSVILWTRRPFTSGVTTAHLTLELAEDADFRRVVATSRPAVALSEDWTCRVLIAGLRPGREYWYRFADAHGFGSRIGRTLTAPPDDADRRSRFAFVSCQNANCGAQNAYRRMIFEDERAPADQRL